MKYLFIEYPKCSTCQKAKKWLEERQVEFEDRHIVENTPTKEELKAWSQRSQIPLNKFFNTSGLVYKKLNLKEKMINLTEDEKLRLLSGNGMLIKRPLLISEKGVLIGFKPTNWEVMIGEE